MGVATYSLALDSHAPQGDMAQDTITYYGTVSFSAAADTYATNGLAAASGKDLKSLGAFGDRTPLKAEFFSKSGSGLAYAYVNSTGKLKILGGGGSGTAAPSEITAGTALNATTPQVATDVVGFEIVVPRSYFT